MNKQAFCETGLLLQGKGNYMNRTSGWGLFFSEKMPLRKTVDYQEFFFCENDTLYVVIQRNDYLEKLS